MLREETGGVIICAFWPVLGCFFDIFLVPFKHNGKEKREFWDPRMPIPVCQNSF